MDGEKMNWTWFGWRREAAMEIEDSTHDATRVEPLTLEDWEAQLVEEGVSSEFAGRIAQQLMPAHREFGRGAAAPLIRSAALTFELQASAHADARRSLRDAREVERLLSAFTGELEKLDEVLEVLAAYAQRMRSKPAEGSKSAPTADPTRDSKPTRRVLH